MCSGNVYSPKIREDLIPVLFKLAKTTNKPMTKIVDEILRSNLIKRRLINEEKANSNGGGIQGFFKRQADNHGLRSTILHPQSIQHNDNSL